MWWSEEKIRYYTVSAERTVFHQKVAEALSRSILPGETVTELGAGLGYVTERLSDMGIDIRGYDSDGRVVGLCNERAGRKLLELKDVLTDPPEKRDVVMMLFFGRITETDTLDYFLSLADHKVIYVMSHHNGHGIKARENKRDRTEEFLRERGLRYTALDLTIPFDQPLRDEEDAKGFADAFYGGGTEIETERSGYEDYPLVFRNTKNITIFTILKEEGTN